jgi:hypothetical protein
MFLKNSNKINTSVYEFSDAKASKSSSSSHLFRSDFITLNIGGFKYEAKLKHLEKLPNSRLGKIRFALTHDELAKYCDQIDLDNNELYFDKTFNQFDLIMDLYRKDHFHYKSAHSCFTSLKDDLDYWHIDMKHLKHCCQIEYIFNHAKTAHLLDTISKIEADLDDACSSVDPWQNLLNILEFKSSCFNGKVIKFTHS